MGKTCVAAETVGRLVAVLGWGEWGRHLLVLGRGGDEAGWRALLVKPVCCFTGVVLRLRSSFVWVENIVLTQFIFLFIFLRPLSLFI